MNLTFEEEELLKEYLNLGLSKDKIITMLDNTKSEYEELDSIANSLSIPVKQMKIDRGEYALHAEDLNDF